MSLLMEHPTFQILTLKHIFSRKLDKTDLQLIKVTLTTTTTTTLFFHPKIYKKEKFIIIVQTMIGALAARNNLRVKNARQPVERKDV